MPYAVPGVIAAIMWGFLYSPNLSPFPAVTSNVDLLSADLVLWSIANVVTWVFVGYNMLIIYSTLLAIPQEIYEAARIDGAGQAASRGRSRSRSSGRPSCSPCVLSIIGTLQLLAEPQTFRSLLQLGGDEHLHPEHDHLRDQLDPQRLARGGVLGRARPGHVRAVLHLPPSQPSWSHSMKTSSGRRAARASLRRTTAMVVMGIFTLYFLIPLWWLVVASTKDRGQLFSTNALWFADFRFFDNVGQLFAYRDGVYLKWLGNSVLYARVGGVIATVIAAMCGYALAKYRFPAAKSSSTPCWAGCSCPRRRSRCRCSCCSARSSSPTRTGPCCCRAS